LLALLLGFISPDTFTVFDSINFLTAIVIGGRGSILGSVLGGFFLAFQTEINKRLADLIPHGQDLKAAIYGVLLIVLMIFAPGGIAGAIRHPRFLRRGRHRRAGGSAAVPSAPAVAPQPAEMEPEGR
jgi:branched-chain amino acid transport system permease protein